jgi:hypothetical protein
MPATSGASGPITTKSIFSRWRSATWPGCPRPDLDAFGDLGDAGIAGRAEQFVHRGDAEIAQHSACSRPPPPTTRIRMAGL